MIAREEFQSGATTSINWRAFAHGSCFAAATSLVRAGVLAKMQTRIASVIGPKPRVRERRAEGGWRVSVEGITG